ncbi:hypothetical protein Vadar_029195 [Vaccinium darrowii]|uniref:Uncharacterized protein n=1 Tax=Vaccinium darrowii TaxID=229202 RepID=A0ACB7YRH5_9ERIC|nr:hypothetical protein Vadar_029195 [Vaccinium darrowii]
MKLKIEENDDGEVQAILRWLNESETAVSSLNSGPIRSENRFENGECEVAHRGGRIASISGSDLLRFAAVSSPMCFDLLLLFLGHSLSHSPDALSRLQDDPAKMFYLLQMVCFAAWCPRTQLGKEPTFPSAPVHCVSLPLYSPSSLPLLAYLEKLGFCGLGGSGGSAKGLEDLTLFDVTYRRFVSVSSPRITVDGVLCKLMTPWAIVCDGWCLEPQNLKPRDTPIQFAERVRDIIFVREGLNSQEGYLGWISEILSPSPQPQREENVDIAPTDFLMLHQDK